MPAPRRRIHDRTRRELVVLHRIAVALTHSLSFSEVLAALSRELMFAVDRASECAISLWDEEGDQLVDIAAYTESGPPVWPRGEVYAPLDLYPHTRKLLQAGRGHYEYRVTDPDLRTPDREVLEHWGWRSAVELPLVVEGRSLGLIEVADHRSARPWSAADLAFCHTIASQAAMAVRNAQLFEDLQRQVDRDPLTGLLNHRAFYERLAAETARCARSGEALGVVVVDLDNFKRLNDSRGHLAGDQALRRTAGALAATCRGGDVAGRLGGDEFALILPAVEDIEAVAERVHAAVTARSGMRVSVGATLARKADRNPVRIVDRADRSLLEAKRAGKGSWRSAA
jgi:diguanylate cyclase (GGDEF)-like protein